MSSWTKERRAGAWTFTGQENTSQGRTRTRYLVHICDYRWVPEVNILTVSNSYLGKDITTPAAILDYSVWLRGEGVFSWACGFLTPIIWRPKWCTGWRGREGAGKDGDAALNPFGSSIWTSLGHSCIKVDLVDASCPDLMDMSWTWSRTFH